MILVDSACDAKYGVIYQISPACITIQDDHNLRLHNLELPVGKIVTAFVENGLEVSEAATSEESLEDYFKRVTGGEGIA
jgi:bacitracin transport system ATP-binding protein